jgi:hypothetical protein
MANKISQPVSAYNSKRQVGPEGSTMGNSGYSSTKMSCMDVELRNDEEKSLTEEGPQSPSSSSAQHPFHQIIGSKAEQKF